MTKLTYRRPTQIRIRPETRATIDSVAQRLRLSITETVALMAETFDRLPEADQLQAIPRPPATSQEVAA
ncbi:MAG: hypothetical protein AAF797_17600 [Planctomycetota bacterium]